MVSLNGYNLLQEFFFLFLWLNKRETRKVEKLTLNVPYPDNVKKLSSIFIFTILCGASKGFIKAFKAPTIKLFEAPQRSVKIKI